MKRRRYRAGVILVWLRVLIAGAFVLCSWSALADGKIFPARFVQTGVETPDQRALLHYSNGVERLVIETSFRGEGTNFAWVIPFPSEPKIEAVSTNFFKHVEAGFQPKVIHGEPHFVAAAWLFLWLAAASGIASVRKAGCAGFRNWIAAMIFLFMLIGASMPMHGVSLRRIAPDDVSILNRSRVGVYDTVVLTGSDSSSILGWLNTNGFAVTAVSSQAIAEYVRDGWVFVASKIATSGEHGRASAPHPLAFTFQSAEAVYPLKLTGAEGAGCRIDLYVYGKARAEVDGFTTEFSGEAVDESAETLKPLMEQKHLFRPTHDGKRRVFDPEVAQFAFPAQIATKLSGNLKSEQMRTDAKVHWRAPKNVASKLYTWDGALARAVSVALVTATVGALLVQLLAPRLGKRTKYRSIAAVSVLAIAGGFAAFFTAKTTPAIVTWNFPGIPRKGVETLQKSLDLFDEKRMSQGKAAPTSLADVQDVAGEPNAFVLYNSYLRTRILESPTAGNIVFQPTPNGVAVLWHDLYGVPHEIKVMTNGPAGGGR